MIYLFRHMRNVSNICDIACKSVFVHVWVNAGVDKEVAPLACIFVPLPYVGYSAVVQGVDV